MDDPVVDDICEQLPANVTHMSQIRYTVQMPSIILYIIISPVRISDIVITPKKDTYADDWHHPKRMSNLVAQSALGEIGWQKIMRYGQRNVSENAMQ